MLFLVYRILLQTEFNITIYDTYVHLCRRDDTTDQIKLKCTNLLPWKQLLAILLTVKTIFASQVSDSLALIYPLADLVGAPLPSSGR